LIRKASQRPRRISAGIAVRSRVAVGRYASSCCAVARPGRGGSAETSRCVRSHDRHERTVADDDVAGRGDTEDLAGCVGVDVKTVERWLNLGRVPHRRHRWTAAKHLKVDETYLWPQVLVRSPIREREANRSELLEIYPDRASVPREVRLRLLSEAQESVDVLVFSGTFLAQTQPPRGPNADRRRETRCHGPAVFR
jgi:hypothetical protein